MKHVSVLLNEVLEYLDPKPGQSFIDATFGAGGHTREILKRIQPGGKLLAFDLNAGAVAEGNGIPGLTVVHENFSHLEGVAKELGFENVAGVLFDLGLSSDELDDSARGFSFQKSGPLDMRFDQSRGVTAAELLGESSERELERLFRQFGEERFSRKIARAVVATRVASAIATTDELFSLIKASLPGPFRHKADDSARRIFQALRIEVNGELESLSAALPQAEALLAPAGRVAVISFHSLEDRIVKRYFVQSARGCVCPPEFPECICGKKPFLKIITRKPVMAGLAEQERNPRSRSAKLRVAERTNHSESGTD